MVFHQLKGYGLWPPTILVEMATRDTLRQRRTKCWQRFRDQGCWMGVCFFLCCAACNIICTSDIYLELPPNSNKTNLSYAVILIRYSNNKDQRLTNGTNLFVIYCIHCVLVSVSVLLYVYCILSTVYCYCTLYLKLALWIHIW